MRYYAGWCDKLDGEVMSAEPGLSYVRLEPYGVVAVIPPWNGSMMGMGQKCGPALAAGNTVVAKPPEVAPFGMLRFAELALEAGAATGCAQRRRGRGRHGLGAGRRIGGVDKISFTGGAETARALMASAARNLTPLALELGGKSPNIVFPDADLDAAATMAAVFGTALLSGQGCALPTRLYVHDDVYDEVVDKVLATLGSLAVGDPLDPATFVGPVVTEEAMDRILVVIDRAKSDGATLLAGGTRLGGDLAHGWFVAPTVFGDVDHDSDLARNEVFGPGPSRHAVHVRGRGAGQGERQPLSASAPTSTPRRRAHPALRARAPERNGDRQRQGGASRRRPRSGATSRVDSAARAVGPGSRRWCRERR